MSLDTDDHVLGEAVAAARAAWPHIALEAPDFVAHLRGLGLSATSIGRRVADLYLALGCARGDQAALAAFNTAILPGARRQLARMGISRSLEEELLQVLRVRLLVGEPPRIATYRGDGSLDAWVRVTAAHLALNELEARAVRDRHTLAAQAEAFVSASDPEVAVARARLRQPLAAALETALGALTPREKTLLRLHILDNLTIDEIGVMYRVHRATAARWLVAIRASVLRAVRSHLGLAARPTSSEFRSIVALLRDELHVSVERALAE
jgi:RNA polymerase sigma-70 factor, ECF subfamily